VLKNPRLFWPLEWLFLLVAAANLGLIFFDLAYLPLREFYRTTFPEIQRRYDPYKGIAPNPTSQNYLQTAIDLQAVLEQPDQALQQEKLLSRLRKYSVFLAEGSPFVTLGRQGVLSRLRSRMAKHVGTADPKDAFKQFWTSANLSGSRRISELQFFNQQIQPLLAKNYDRSFAEDGEYVESFWEKIDLWFMAIFAVEFVLRIFFARSPGETLKSALGRNSIFLLQFFPAVNLIPGVRLGWLGLVRLIPFGERLETLNIFPSPVGAFVGRYSTVIVDELADQVFVKVLDQVKQLVEQSNPDGLLPTLSGNAPPSALGRFVKSQSRLAVQEVMPKVRPQLEEVITHALKQNTPIPGAVVPGLTQAVLNTAFSAANAVVQDDPELDRLIRVLTAQLVNAIVSTSQVHGTARDIQGLVVELIDQAKQEYQIRNGVPLE
jgi:hypothetical protein